MWDGPLEQIGECKFRIPKSYKPGMRVDGIIYASPKLLAGIKQDRAAEQVANVAFLPGIVNHSLAMPDIHWGYGFCLTKDSRILSHFGFYKKIDSFEADWDSQQVRAIDLDRKIPVETSILRFIKLKPKEVVKITTKIGYEIKVTDDHPLFTPLGMRPVKELSLADKVAIFPFCGVPYRKPSKDVIISQKEIKKVLAKLGRKPHTPRFEIILQKLSKRNFLSLSYGHPKLPYILKIMGFIFGDGSMNFIGKRGDGVLHFSGKPADLEIVRKDLRNIGYTPSPIHLQRKKASRHDKKYHDCYSFFVNASSLVVLLEALGVPRGAKVHQAYRIPRWIFKAPLWQKRLFLAALFGCELRRPHRRLERRGYFNAPVFPMAKGEKLLKNGKDFLGDISKLLKQFGVHTLYIYQRRRHVNTKGKASWALELLISPKPDNLFNLWSKIGFEYNFARSFEASLAVGYLKVRRKVIAEKEYAVKVAIPRLLQRGMSYQAIALQLAGNPLTKRFITDICCKLAKGRDVIPRIPFNFPSFEDYRQQVTQGLGQSGMVWDEIQRIEKIPYDDFVYDFTVKHSDHNFIADNFVVSNCIGGVAATDAQAGGVISPGGVGFDINCGVRLVKSSLTLDDVKHRLTKLVDTLYQNVPSGVGSKGEIKLSLREEEKLLVGGAQWAVGRGLGAAADLECCEEQGAIEGADPDSVSQRAYERGRQQAGTLGSGNHFIEVQVIDQIFDEAAAASLGLSAGQVTVMIHSGSRGFGYQVCDDYSRSMVGCLSKYGIEVPDRQLACAPLTSPEAKKYIGAMKAAANYAWANRQVLMHLVRLSFEQVFSKGWQGLNMALIYDVAHNIAKFENYTIDGKTKILCVHRKGATRAFGPGNIQLPLNYRPLGQPVIIPGDMGRASYLLLGTKKAETDSFGSTCHGAGRAQSRHQALKTINFDRLLTELASAGIEVRAKNKRSIVEEAPAAYKNVDDVVEAVSQAGLSRKVCRMRPLCVVKG